MAIIERAETRLGEFDNREKIEELTLTICDRLLLRAGIPAFNKEGERIEFPALLESVAVDAVCKAYNQLNYEGISSESIDTINTTFISNILDEYEEEIKAFAEIWARTNNEAAGIVRFI